MECSSGEDQAYSGPRWSVWTACKSPRHHEILSCADKLKKARLSSQQQTEGSTEYLGGDKRRNYAITEGSSYELRFEISSGCLEGSPS